MKMSENLSGHVIRLINNFLQKVKMINILDDFSTKAANNWFDRRQCTKWSASVVSKLCCFRHSYGVIVDSTLLKSIHSCFHPGTKM